MPTLNPNIWQLQSSGDIDALMEALQNPDAATRRSAAAALRALAAWRAVFALRTALALEEDEDTKAVFAAALEYLEREASIRDLIETKNVQALTKMLSSSNIDDIKAACQALGAIGDRHSAEPLVILFRNPLQSNAARLAAAEALLKLESAPAVVTLLGALRRDNWQVRRNAAAVLGQLQAGWATEALIDALNDPHQAVQRTVAAALRRINTPEALQAVNTFDEVQKRSNAGTQPLPPLEGTEPPAEEPKLSDTGRLAKFKKATQQAAAVATGEVAKVPSAASSEAVPPADAAPAATQPSVATQEVTTPEVAAAVKEEVTAAQPTEITQEAVVTTSIEPPAAVPPVTNPATVTQESAAVTSPEPAKTVAVPPATNPAAVTQESAVVTNVEPDTPSVAQPAAIVSPKSVEPEGPITKGLPRPPWLKAIPEPPTHLDDTKPSRPTQLKSPFKDGDGSKPE